uniref:Uncharacterized protein n=1 Tax=Anguilla anguilla TaxID=7936 RepID=A0A0E9R1N1_ANGAN
MQSSISRLFKKTCLSHRNLCISLPRRQEGNEAIEGAVLNLTTTLAIPH